MLKIACEWFRMRSANAVIGNSIIDLEASSRCLLVNCCKSSTKHDTHLLSYLSENIESSTLEVFFLEAQIVYKISMSYAEQRKI